MNLQIVIEIGGNMIISKIVTVVVPCFNNATTIGETIESVLQQTVPNWELICVDDGSSDDTTDVIKKYVEKDDRIKLLKRDTDPKGGSHCRNIGAFAAEGEYLIFLDGDDLLARTCIENRLKSIVDTNYDFVVFPMGRFINNDINNQIKAGRLYENRDYLYYYASGNAGWPITSPIIKKSFFVSLGGFDVRFQRSQDIEFNLRAIALTEGGYKVECKKEADCFYRIGATISGIPMAKFKKALESYPLLLELLDNLDKKSVFKDKWKLSKAKAVIFCNGFIQYDVLKLNKSMVDFPGWLNKENIPQGLSLKERMLIGILYVTVQFTRLNFWLARFASKYIRTSFER